MVANVVLQFPPRHDHRPVLILTWSPHTDERHLQKLHVWSRVLVHPAHSISLLLYFSSRVQFASINKISNLFMNNVGSQPRPPLPSPTLRDILKRSTDNTISKNNQRTKIVIFFNYFPWFISVAGKWLRYLVPLGNSKLYDMRGVFPRRTKMEHFKSECRKICIIRPRQWEPSCEALFGYAIT